MIRNYKNALLSVLFLSCLVGCRSTPPRDAPQPARSDVQSTTSSSKPDASSATSVKSATSKAAPKLTVPQALGISILKAYNNNPGLRGHQINVGTDNTSVILDGKVHSAAQKKLAEQVAHKLAKKYKVTNRLQVVES